MHALTAALRWLGWTLVVGAFSVAAGIVSANCVGLGRLVP